MSFTAQKGKWMIYLMDSQNSWAFSKRNELLMPALGAGTWAGLSPSSGHQLRPLPFSGQRRGLKGAGLPLGIDLPWCCWGRCPLQRLLQGDLAPGGCPQDPPPCQGGPWLDSLVGAVRGSFIFSWAVALVPLRLHLAHKPAVPGQARALFQHRGRI